MEEKKVAFQLRTSPSPEIDVGAKDGCQHDQIMHAMIRVLRQNNALLDLSSVELKQVLPYLGAKPVAALVEEVYHHINATNPGTARYHDDWCPSDSYDGEPIYEYAWTDVRMLAALPGSTAEVVTLTVDLFNTHLDSMLRYYRYGQGDYRDLYEICKQYDALLLFVFRTALEADWSWYDMESPRGSWKSFKAKRAETVEVFEVVAANEDVQDRLCPVFPRSVDLMKWLNEQHSKETGIMLANKASGHLLPPELVGLIADCLYDEQLIREIESSDSWFKDDQGTQEGGDGVE